MTQPVRYIVLSGSVLIKPPAGKGEAVLVQEGSAVCEEELLMKQQLHTCTVITNERSDLIEVTADEYTRLLRANRSSDRQKIVEAIERSDM